MTQDQARALALTLRLQWWPLLWPGYCKECGAAGGFYSPGSYWEPPDYDPCDCLLEGRCPRCGALNGEGWSEDPDDTCPVCGWCDSTPGAPEWWHFADYAQE